MLVTTLQNLSCNLMSQHNSVAIFVKDKETIGVNTCNELLDAVRNNNACIKLLTYASKEDMAFQLGTILNANEKYVISEDVLKLPDSIAGNYQISYIKQSKTGTPRKRKSKKENTAKEKENVPLPINPPEETDNRKAVKNVSVAQQKTETQHKEQSVHKAKATTDDSNVPGNTVHTPATGNSTERKETFIGSDEDKKILEFLQRTNLRGGKLPEPIKVNDRDFGKGLLSIIAMSCNKIDVIRTHLNKEYSAVNAAFIADRIAQYLG